MVRYFHGISFNKETGGWRKNIFIKKSVFKPSKVSSDGPSSKFLVAFQRALKSAQLIIVDIAYTIVAREASSAQKPV